MSMMRNDHCGTCFKGKEGVTPYRLLILVLSLSILLLTPSGAGATVRELGGPDGVPLSRLAPAVPALPLSPLDLPDEQHPVITAPSATEGMVFPQGGDDGSGGDGLPAQATASLPALLRLANLTLGGAPPRGQSRALNPWPTGPPSI